MKKLLRVAVVAAAVLLAARPAAAAVITSPGTGGATRYAGAIRFVDATTSIPVNCVARLGGTVLSRLSSSVTSGTTNLCGLALFTMVPTFDWLLELDSSYTFTISDVSITNTLQFTPPYSLTCIYEGSISGTHTTGPTSRFTITGDTLARVPPSNAACTNPTISGTLTSNLTIL